MSNGSLNSPLEIIFPNLSSYEIFTHHMKYTHPK